MIQYNTIQSFEEELLSQQVLMDVLKGYKRPHDKLTEMVKKKELIQLKRGYYIPGEKLKMIKPEPFLIANHLNGPSYISLESALSYWGYIPERVEETISITVKKRAIYHTPIGRYSYYHSSVPYYAYGIQSILLTEKQRVLIASPEKALCDKIIFTSGIQLRSTKNVRDFLEDNLRISSASLNQLNHQEITTWIAKAPKATSLEMLVKTLQQL